MKYYRDEACKYLGGWDDGLAPPEGGIEVPFPPDDARQKWFGDKWVPAPIPEPSPLILGPVSAAALTISGGEVLGIETSVNFGAAFMIDVDTYWVFFMKPEQDTSYLVLANVPYTKYTDYIEIKAVDLAEVGLTTWRVQ